MEKEFRIENLEFQASQKKRIGVATFDLTIEGRLTIRACALSYNQSGQYVVLGPYPGAKSHRSVVTFSEEFAAELLPLVLAAVKAEAERISAAFRAVA